MLKAETKKKVIKKFGGSAENTGSSEVQIGLLSKRISSLQDHLKTHKKDRHSRLGLVKMVELRRRLLKFLEKKSPESYKEIYKATKLKN